MVIGSVRRLHSGIVAQLRLWLVCPASLVFSFCIYFPVFHHYWKVYNILSLKLSLKMPRSIFCVKLRVVVFKKCRICSHSLFGVWGTPFFPTRGTLLNLWFWDKSMVLEQHKPQFYLTFVFWNGVDCYCCICRHQARHQCGCDAPDLLRNGPTRNALLGQIHNGNTAQWQIYKETVYEKGGRLCSRGPSVYSRVCSFLQ